MTHVWIEILLLSRLAREPAQDRLDALRAVIPGHPLVSPRDPEVGKRADNVPARCRPG